VLFRKTCGADLSVECVFSDLSAPDFAQAPIHFWLGQPLPHAMLVSHARHQGPATSTIQDCCRMPACLVADGRGRVHFFFISPGPLDVIGAAASLNRLLHRTLFAFSRRLLDSDQDVAGVTLEALTNVYFSFRYEQKDMNARDAC
jgi:hypothetical protein